MSDANSLDVLIVVADLGWPVTPSVKLTVRRHFLQVDSLPRSAHSPPKFQRGCSMRICTTMSTRKLLIAGGAVVGILGLGSGALAQTAQPKATAAPRVEAPAESAGQPSRPQPNWIVSCSQRPGQGSSAGLASHSFLDRRDNAFFPLPYGCRLTPRSRSS
jgi:hypothetical protein